MRTKFLLVAGIFMMFAVVSCQQGAVKGYSIKGNIENARDKSVSLEKVNFSNKAEKIAEVKAKDGIFNFNFDTPLEAGIYRLAIDRKSVYLLSSGEKASVEISGDFNSLSNMTTEILGSEMTQNFNKTLSDYNKKRDIYTVKESVKKMDPLVESLVLINIFGARPEFAAMHMDAAKRLAAKYPDASISKNYTGLANNLQKSQARKEASEKIKVGAPAPDIVMPNPDGKILKLSDLKGKVVLLDFWASWCGPCRKANPKVVSIYNKYRDKGFTVFSVSLDGLDSRTKSRMNEDQIKSRLASSKQRWLAAIKKDNLTWDTHVSTLDKWDTKSATDFGVSSIPRTFLIDRDGNIAAINPRFNLEDALLKLL